VTPRTAQRPVGVLPRRALRAVRRLTRALVVCLLLAVALVAADAVVLHVRLDEVDVATVDGPGRTWVVVGLDTRDGTLPAGIEVGDADAVPQSRADVVLVVHEADDGQVTSWSVPRDLVVTTLDGPRRLTLTWATGPDTFTAALCSLGIPAEHVVTMSMTGLVDVVDAVGGVTVQVEAPVRDLSSGLLVPTAGPVELDGPAALAWVRSRQPDQWVGGRWVPAAVDPDRRSTATAQVVRGLLVRLDTGPAGLLRLQRTAWTASGHVAVDPGTSLTDLVALARLAGDGDVRPLPAATTPGTTLARFPDQTTATAVAAGGMWCEA
jgi:LCP family protein required for cell wall assembly